MYLIKGYKGTYYVKYQKANGKFTQVSTRTSNKKQAIQFLLDFKLGQLNPTQRPLNRRKLIVKEFLEEVSKIFEKKIFDKNFVKYFGEDRLLESITPLDVHQYQQWRVNCKKYFVPEKTVSPTTVNMETKALRALINKAINFGLCETNPFRKLTLLKVPKKGKYVFDDNEIKLLLKAISHPVVKDIVIFTLFTGCRLSEVLNLQWKEIDFEKMIITINNKKDFTTKTNDIRYIPMSKQLMKFLKTFFDNLCEKRNINILDRYVFPKGNTGYHYHKNFISRSFKRAVRRAGLSEDLHFHSLRHTTITNLIKVNESIHKVQKFIGHKNINTTLSYTHLIIDDLRDTAESLNVPN